MRSVSYRKHIMAVGVTMEVIHCNQETLMLLGHPVLFKSLCYVDGRWGHSDSASTVAVQNPADQSVIGQVPMLEPAQIEQAVDAAHRAFGTWGWRPLARRTARLLGWAEVVL